MTEKKPHHHGNLREALIAAGIDLVRHGGPDALSIRKVAAAAGVSHAAPAHHFPSLAHLRTAVMARGHWIFTEHMEAGIAETDGSPRAAALGASLGYLRFALAYPGLFDLMFGTQLPDHDDPDFCAGAEASYGVLQRISAPFDSSTPEETELAIWSLVHGFASLSLTGRGGDKNPVTLEAQFTQLFTRLSLTESAK